MTPPALRASGLRKRFGDTVALDGVDLEVAPGELVSLVGPSGCGKSTLLRVVAGLTTADAGRVELAGATVDDARHHTPPERRGVGLVFQEHALFPHLTVGGNVAFGLRGSASRSGRDARVAEVLATVGLRAHQDRYPHELSGGERQRVALARAIAPGPALLLLDEPFASLDPNLRTRVRADVVAILRAAGTPAVFVTHDQAEALAVGDRVAVLESGRLRQLAPPWEVFHRPADRFVAAFMGEADFVEVTAAAGRLEGELGSVTAPPGTRVANGPVEAMVRPDDVTFEVDPAGDASVIDAEFRGSAWTYRLRLGSGRTVRSTRSHLVTVPTGTRVRASLVPGHVPVVIADGSQPGAVGDDRIG